MKAIGSIYLSWRKGKGSRRKIVGLIKKNATSGVRFSYLQKGVLEAQKEGFTPYTDFPDTTKVYSENVLEIFGQRLIKTERPDINKYLDFWAIDTKFKDVSLGNQLKLNYDKWAENETNNRKILL